ncbi:MAG: hypothetical protein ACK5LP_09760 [Campylobacteraceae bacterium]
MIKFIIKGFGKKNYFTLATIQAYSTYARIKTQINNAKKLFKNKKESDEEKEDDPPDKCSTLSLILNCPCHCNCFFKKRTARVLKHSKHLCFKRCNCRFYSFRRSGSHPPKIPVFFLHVKAYM